MEIFQVGIFRGLIFHGGVWSVGILRVEIFPGGIFLELFLAKWSLTVFTVTSVKKVPMYFVFLVSFFIEDFFFASIQQKNEIKKEIP